MRTTFDTAAGLYQQARPDYPEQLYQALIETTGIEPGDRLLEALPPDLHPRAGAD